LWLNRESLGGGKLTGARSHVPPVAGAPTIPPARPRYGTNESQLRTKRPARGRRKGDAKVLAGPRRRVSQDAFNMDTQAAPHGVAAGVLVKPRVSDGAADPDFFASCASCGLRSRYVACIGTWRLHRPRSCEVHPNAPRSRARQL